MLIYKIANDALWQELNLQGRTLGSADDLRDGFIHLSSEAQLLGTYKKYFASAVALGEKLWLITVDSDLLDREQLRFEPSRDGALFPHLYGALLLSDVKNVHGIAREADLLS